MLQRESIVHLFKLTLAWIYVYGVSHLSLQTIPINLTKMILDSNTNVTQGNMKIPCTQRNRFVSVLVDMSVDSFSIRLLKSKYELKCVENMKYYT